MATARDGKGAVYASAAWRPTCAEGSGLGERVGGRIQSVQRCRDGRLVATLAPGCPPGGFVMAWINGFLKRRPRAAE